MTNPVLPASFLPIVEGYSFNAPQGVYRTEVQGGMSRYAMQYDRGPQEFKVTMIMNPDKFAIWNLFFLRVIKKGSISFDMQLDSGFGVSTHTCNILPGTYNANLVNGTFYSITFSVEAESKAFDYEMEDVNSIMDLYSIYGESYDDVILRIAQFANEDTLVLV
jgi:hypothetical protein